MLVVILIPFVHAEDLPSVSNVANNLASSGPTTSKRARSSENGSRTWKAAWIGSLAFEAAGTAYDSYTSYHQGPYESSALLRSSDGQFGNRAIVIKTVTFAGFAAAQWLVVRKWPKMTKMFIPVNTFLGIEYLRAGVHNEQFLAAHH
jgi:hypothetical protein